MWRELEREEVEDFAVDLQVLIQDEEDNLRESLGLDEEERVEIN